MAKFVLTHAYFLRYDQKQWDTGLPYPPLGTLYAASTLRATGHEVNFVDMMFAHAPTDIAPALKDAHDFFIIYDDGFNYLTKMCLTNMREAAFKMIGLAKENNCTVIISGSDSTDHCREYHEAGADYVLIGEAEQTLPELIDTLGKKQDVSSVRGISLLKDGQCVRTAPRPVMRDLDSLPFPAWDLLDVAPYRERWMKNAGYFSLNVGTTRGCPYKCNWCAKPIYGNRYNARSPQDVVQELKMMKDMFAMDHIWFCDDIFGLKPGWVQEFAALVEQEKLSFRFKIQSRADLLVQEQYVEALARAGCHQVWMGAESGSQKILDAMDKGITVDQISRATELLRQHDIRPCFFIQFGYLGETRDDIDLTIGMINELLPDDIGISVSYPLPGTVFHEKVKEQLKQKANWTDSNEMALMFRNTFPASFYKHLHQHVHRKYRKQLALQSTRKLFQHPFSAKWATVRKALTAVYLTPSLVLSSWRLKKLEKAS
jgi:anaerobic magnesium-protoporphyrin IX monomethyl ester cyclase